MLLIVYGATAGVSVVKLYAGAFFPGIMLAGLYVAYVIAVAKWKPHLAPPLPLSERLVPLPSVAQTLSARGSNAITGLFGGLKDASLAKKTVLGQLLLAVLPALVIAALLTMVYLSATAPLVVADTSGLVETGGLVAAPLEENPRPITVFRSRPLSLVGSRSRRPSPLAYNSRQPQPRRLPPSLPPKLRQRRQQAPLALR